MKSLTGYVLLVGSFPVHGVSKLQLEIAVSMTEAAYIALSTALHNLISLRTQVDEEKDLLSIQKITLLDILQSVFYSNGALILTMTP